MILNSFDIYYLKNYLCILKILFKNLKYFLSKLKNNSRHTKTEAMYKKYLINVIIYVKNNGRSGVNGDIRSMPIIGNLYF